ncbi:MAG: MOSC domain-containing protein [Acidimicrobiia bacterium]|nr:MOSC domain-containing protein [Acidimicrobiia bacterium]
MTLNSLETGLAHVSESPTHAGEVHLIVQRPAQGKRKIVDNAEIDETQGLIGDNWRSRGSRRSPDGSANPNAQITLMNSRAAALVAGTRDRWALAGDQIYTDLDLSEDNLPPGTQLKVGTATIEVSDQPHTGCVKFKTHFGDDALKFVNSETGRSLRLRGMNARVIESGKVSLGDKVEKL